MGKNRLQILYNRLEREFAATEDIFLSAEKARYTLKENYDSILKTVGSAKAELGHYPQAAVLKRIGLIETLLKDLLLRYETERRHFNALGFLLSRLRSNLATEMLEPKLYQKIRDALQQEESLKHLREKYPDAGAVITAPGYPPKKPKPAKTVRLMLIGAANLHYAIPVVKILKKAPAAGPIAEKLLATGFKHTELPVNGKPAAEYTHAIAYCDLKEQRRLVYCDAYFTPVEIPQKMLKQMVTFSDGLAPAASTPVPALRPPWRPQITFYGRRFFLYGARLSYTVRPGGRRH